MRRRSLFRHLSLIGLVCGIAAAGSTGCANLGGADATAPADSAAGELGFRMAGRGGAAIVVPVYINGQGPIDLILDTGATLTCVDTSLVRELALPERRLSLGVTVGVGGTGRLESRGVDSLRVGGAVVRRIDVCAMDLRALKLVQPDVRGLLGLNVLRNFVMTLDFDRRVLRLARPDTTS